MLRRYRHKTQGNDLSLKWLECLTDEQRAHVAELTDRKFRFYAAEFGDPFGPGKVDYY